MEGTLAGVVNAQRGPFTAAQALDDGYSRREIRDLVDNETWSRLRRGVYIERHLIAGMTPADLHVVMLRALVLKTGRSAVASHVTAAVVHGFALLEPALSLIHVTRPGRPPTSRTEASVHHHAASLSSQDVVEINGLLTTTAARTVTDLARESTFRKGVVAADHALHHHLVSHGDLRTTIAACADWPGARTATRVIAFADAQAGSVGESVSRVAFAEMGLPAPELQVPIFDTSGLVGVVDFLWKQHRTIGEFDGRLKYGANPKAAANAIYAEKRREDRLRALGYQVVRFGWVDATHRPEQLRRSVSAAFARADAPLRSAG